MIVKKTSNLPGLTADSSFFDTSTYYSISARNCHSNSQQFITPKDTEPAESGRRAWLDLERACGNLQCGECRKDCLTFINGLHDAINIKLGKSMRFPNDFIYLRDFVNDMSRKTFR